MSRKRHSAEEIQTLAVIVSTDVRHDAVLGYGELNLDNFLGRSVLVRRAQPRGTISADRCTISDSEGGAMAVNDELVGFNKWVMGSVAAASFTALLSIVAGRRDDPLSHSALLCLVAALPLLCIWLVVLNHPANPYRVSRVMIVLPWVGIGLSLFGIGFLLASHSPVACAAWAFFCGASIWIMADSHHRWRLAAQHKRVHAVFDCD